MQSKSNVIEASDDLQLLSGSRQPFLRVLNFYASWHQPSVDLNAVFDALASTFPALVCIQLEAEQFPDTSEHFQVSSVSTFVVLDRMGVAIEKLEGADSKSLESMFIKYSADRYNNDLLVKATDTTIKSIASAHKNIDRQIKHLLASHQVLIFIRGTPSSSCIASTELLKIISAYEVEYATFDITIDEQFKAAIEKKSSTQDFPQLYIDSKFIGTLPAVQSLIESNLFQEIIPSKQTIQEKCLARVKSGNVVVFIKGTRQTPRCGFSKKLVKLLSEVIGESYVEVDILEDDDIRQGMKVIYYIIQLFSDWPTFPQVYINQEFVGGLDVFVEQMQDPQFMDTLKSAIRAE